MGLFFFFHEYELLTAAYNKVLFFYLLKNNFNVFHIPKRVSSRAVGWVSSVLPLTFQEHCDSEARTVSLLEMSAIHFLSSSFRSSEI